MERENLINAHLDSNTNNSEARAEGTHRKKLKIKDEEIRLSIGNTVIVADKRKLIESSPYFASLLHFHADANLNAVSLEPPENVHIGTFLAMLHSLTNPEVKLHISATNVWDCIVLSKYFQLEHIEEKCYRALRKMLCTLTMDGLLRLWRNGNACAVKQVTTQVLVCISLKMESASQSTEFVDLTADELVALMSDDGFLPLVERDVCKAVTAWFLHDRKHRKKPHIVDRIVAELVWSDSTRFLIKSISRRCQKPEKLPQRMINSSCQVHPRQVLLEQAGDKGVVAGNYIYGIFWHSFYRTDLNNKDCDGEELTLVETGYESDQESTQYKLCQVKLSDVETIGCFASFWQRTWLLTEHDVAYHTFDELRNTIALYDTATDEWQHLPLLPFCRVGPVMLQNGSFLYIIGGIEHKPYEAGEGNAHHCYRLDLAKFTACQLERDGEPEQECEWERIADLNAPRIDHRAKIQYGRIVVDGGQTETRDVGGYKGYEDARWSEAYDTTLNTWTVFDFEPAA